MEMRLVAMNEMFVVRNAHGLSSSPTWDVSKVFYKDGKGNLININDSNKLVRIVSNSVKRLKPDEVRQSNVVHMQSMRTEGNPITSTADGFWRGYTVGDILDALYNLEENGEEIPFPDELEELKFLYAKIDGLKLFHMEMKMITAWYYEIMNHLESIEVNEEE